MIRRTFLAALPLIAATPALAHPPRQPDPVESKSLIEEIKLLRDKLARAVTAKEARALRAFYADPFTYTDEFGKLHNKEARIAAALAGEPMIENAPASELTYQVFAGPTVVITGKSSLLNTKEQHTYDVRWVAVYVTGRDGWLLAVSQATRLPK